MNVRFLDFLGSVMLEAEAWNDGTEDDETSAAAEELYNAAEEIMLRQE